MDVTERQRRLLGLCAIRVDGVSVDWSLIARQGQFEEGLDALWAGRVLETSAAARRSLPVLRRGIGDPDALGGRVAAEIAAAERAGAELVTVLDEGYPANLRLISNRPPFLFYRGTLAGVDARSVAVVGTRDASEAGLGRAAEVAGRLAEQHVTVVSGLARGIDTAAHRAALERGGRTIAVLGTGITGCYPPENRELAGQITGAGALVSQFWPTQGPHRDSFPRRNVVTSGLSQGTVVIEASHTSGAKMQARLALEHGKRVFLLEALVDGQDWARKYVGRPGAITIGGADEVLPHLASPEQIQRQARQNQQLSLTLL
ncbi:MAG TPA: DNA-processing protein DprA [Streptosporangiaceae bacterium]|nr:DNA-processing protein DprA [Streptosporangiaceae bacterium]